MDDKTVLEKFLNFNLDSAENVLAEFARLDNARYQGSTHPLESFVYIPGSREDRVLLVAHADTVFGNQGKHKIIFEDGKYKSGEPDVGIGADDRAGCAILYLLKDMGHSLLITNGEELHCLGSYAIKAFYPELYAELNEHQYIIQFDRQRSHDYKVYNIPVSLEFKNFIEKNTGYSEPDKRSNTDITVLCSKICGVNLSIGYYREHKHDEYLVYDEWKHTLDIARKMLEGKQPKFPL